MYPIYPLVCTLTERDNICPLNGMTAGSRMFHGSSFLGAIRQELRRRHHCPTCLWQGLPWAFRKQIWKPQKHATDLPKPFAWPVGMVVGCQRVLLLLSVGQHARIAKHISQRTLPTHGRKWPKHESRCYVPGYHETSCNIRAPKRGPLKRLFPSCKVILLIAENMKATTP